MNPLSDLPSAERRRIRLLGLLYRLWASSLRIQGDPLPPAPALLALWHRNLFAALWAYRHKGVAILASRHRDGRRIAEIARSLGYVPVLGSSTRGGTAGALGLLRVLRSPGRVAITPDGPKGPRFVVKPGAVELARLAQVPVFAVGVACRPARTVNSWDRFVVPLPLARCRIRILGPLNPAGLTPDHLARALHRADREARARLLHPTAGPMPASESPG